MRISLNASTKDISQVITTSDALCVDLKASAERHISFAEAFAVKAKDRYAFAAVISPTGVTLKGGSENICRSGNNGATG